MLRIFIALVAMSSTQSLVALDPFINGQAKEQGESVSLEERALSDDVEAMYNLSVQNLALPLAKIFGFSTYNKHAAFYWANKAYENGSIKAITRLACLYEKGLGVEKDIAKALELYTKALDAGDLEAKVRLAMFYTPNPRYKTLQKYANEEKAKALIADFLKEVNARDDLDIKYYSYAIKTYLEGKLCEKDVTKAVSIIEKVYKQNELRTKYDSTLHDFKQAMIFCYIRGIGVEKDEAKALEIYNEIRRDYIPSNIDFRAYELGLLKNLSAKDYNDLARDYFFSNDLGDLKALYEGNKEKAKEFYEKAGDMGYHLSYYHLANIYSNDKDYEKAFSLLNKSFNGIGEKPQGDELGVIFKLAKAYAEGKGTEKNIIKAVELYEQAVAFGYSSAYQDLGFLYFKGDGITQDYKKALEYLLKAEKTSRSTNIYCSIAKCYEQDGKISLAIDSYKKALNLTFDKKVIEAKIKELSDSIGEEVVVAEKLAPLDERAMAGDVEAMYELATKYLHFTSIRSASYNKIESANSGFYWYKKAYEGGVTDAIYALARCYDGGLGTTRDEEKAKALYKEAWQNGNATALLHIVNKEKPRAIFSDPLGLIDKDSDENEDSENYQELLKVARERDDLAPEVYEYLAIKLIEKKDPEAIIFLEKIVKNLNVNIHNKARFTNACIALAYCYATATFTEKNEAKAIELINNLSENISYIRTNKSYIFVSNLLGLYELKTDKDFYDVATVYDSYFEVSSYDSALFEQNEDKAAEFYAKSAALGNLEAKMRLGNKYHRDNDTKKALDLYLEVVKDYNEYKGFLSGYDQVLSFIAKAYEQGEIIEKDIEKALEFYQKLRDSNISYARALTNAKIYFYEQNYEKARNILEGEKYLDRQCNLMLAEIYAKGLGTPKDLKKAISLYTMLSTFTPSPDKEKIQARIKELGAELESE